MSAGGEGEVFGDGFEEEIEAAVDRLGQGRAPAGRTRAPPARASAEQVPAREAPRHHSSAISSRIQDLASSELKNPMPPGDAEPSGSHVALPRLAADGEAEPELSWAYRQQLMGKLERQSLLLAAGGGAVVGAVATALITVGIMLVPPRGGQPAMVQAPVVEAPTNPPVLAAPVAIASPAPPAAALPQAQPAAPAVTAATIDSPRARGSGTTRAPLARSRPPPSRKLPPPEPPAATEQDEDGERPLSDGEMEDQFEKEYGAHQSAPAPEGRPTVFIPPAPDIPAALSEAEILQVVVAHKSEIVGCVKEGGGEATSGEKRRITMRWDIEPDGRTSDVAIATAGLEGSPVGACLADHIATWRFPPHSKPQPPIRFPFTY